VYRVAGLIDDIVDFARGRLGARIHGLLAPVLEQVVSELRMSVPNRQIEADFDLPLPIKCDPSRIRKFIPNLLGNALAQDRLWSACTSVRAPAGKFRWHC
jgi:phosphoserine phosphatase RsbU/P